MVEGREQGVRCPTIRKSVARELLSEGNAL